MYMKVGDESHGEEGLSVMNRKRECKGEFLLGAGELLALPGVFGGARGISEPAVEVGEKKVAQGQVLGVGLELNAPVGQRLSLELLGVGEGADVGEGGLCQVSTGEGEAALDSFTRCIALKPDYADAYYQLGTLYIGQNKVKEAVENLEKFLELAPGHEKAGVARQLLDYLKKQAEKC
jgi:tetratricopeptide (TPR) repeat protein